jgi:hypothetical protein
MPAPTHWIVTANFTEDGAVAWRRADGTWSRRIADAGLVDEPTAKDQSTKAGATEQREICDPYGIEVHVAGDTIDPLTARQRIRANGPTIQLRRTGQSD